MSEAERLHERRVAEARILIAGAMDAASGEVAGALRDLAERAGLDADTLTEQNDGILHAALMDVAYRLAATGEGA